jgi:predicted  nucleic acid-binding Zn-ribbon protein
MTKRDSILRLLTEIKLELKETKEAIEKLDERLEKIEKQTLSTNSFKLALNTRKKKNWKYPSKMK